MNQTIAEKIISSHCGRTVYAGETVVAAIDLAMATDGICDEDQLRIVVGGSNITLHNLSNSHTVTACAPGGLILEIFEAGGLVNYIRSSGGFPPG